MIYSILIINKAGLNLLERRYADPIGEDAPDASLISGMLVAIAQYCDNLTNDEIQTVTLGSSSFFLLRFMDLLLVMHTDLGHSKYLSLAKLQRIGESFVEKFPWLGSFDTGLFVNDSPELYQTFIPILDAILMDKSAMELEIIIDSFLTGKGSVGTLVRDLREKKTLLSSADQEWIPRITQLCNLFHVFFEYSEKNPQNRREHEKYALYNTKDLWIVGLKREHLLLLSLFKGKIDHTILMDVLHGTLGNILSFISEYYNEDDFAVAPQTVLVIGDSMECALLGRMMEFEDYAIFKASNIEFALAKMQLKAPQLVIFDRNGASESNIKKFLDEMENNRQFSKIPIFVIRNSASEEDHMSKRSLFVYNLYLPIRRDHIEWIRQVASESVTQVT